MSRMKEQKAGRGRDRRMNSLREGWLDGAFGYLLNKSPYLKYNRYLSKGFPIGTGVIVGACRHLVKDRMGITGAKWTLQGAEAVLRGLTFKQGFRCVLDFS